MRMVHTSQFKPCYLIRKITNTAVMGDRTDLFFFFHLQLFSCFYAAMMDTGTHFIYLLEEGHGAISGSAYLLRTPWSEDHVGVKVVEIRHNP